MEIHGWISEHGQQIWAEYLLEFLNVVPRKETKAWYFLGMMAGIPMPMESAKGVAPTELREQAIREFQSTLSGLVDQWIDSGKQGEGEQPWTRTVRYGAPESIEITLLRFWKRHPPQVLFTGETQSIFTQAPPRHSDWLHLAGRSDSDVLERARDYAIGFFASMIDSPSRYRIFKCAKCRAYFVTERMPKKGIVITGGSYCEREQCRNAASSRRVYDRRDVRLTRMVGWAADAALTWKDERRFGSMADWVVKHVRKKQPSGERPIQVNWYTLHRKEIEEAIEQRKHAKG